jgi:peptide/nickel transport system substrate-binding protein
MSVVSSDTAVTQIDAGAVDLYASNLSTPQDFQAIEEAGLERSYQFGLYYELTFNPVGPEFEGTGGLNPFSSAAIREAMNWLVDRDYIDQEIYGGTATPKFFSLVSGFPDYARYVDTIRPFETIYAYDFDKAEGVFTTEMEAMGAVKNADGMWTYNGEVVELIFLIRNDSDGTRIPIGDYVANQLEAIGFAVDRQYKTSSEASPLWVLGNPNDGLWHVYTGAWGSSAISRDDGGDFQFFYSPNSAYGFTALWQSYPISDEFLACSEALANNTFTTLDERDALFSDCLGLTFESGVRMWIVDGRGASTWHPSLQVAYDLSAGVDINNLWPYTLRFDAFEGGIIRWGTPDLFVDPANPIAGSNWTYDAQWQLATNDFDCLPNPHTGLSLPQRIESASVVIEEGLPVGQTYDWVDLSFSPQIDVPGDAWINWDPAAQTFITVDEAYPDGLTAKRFVTVTYPADMFDTVFWHDGSALSVADFVMAMIMTFEPGTEGSMIYDESQAGTLASFLATFKGFRIVSTDPLTIEYYSDTYYLDAEQNVTPFRTIFWPEYGYGNSSWAMIAVGNLAEADEALAYSGDKADALEVEWMNWIGGPSLEILDGYLTQAATDTYIPYEPTLGAYITAEEAATRYANLQAWYAEHGHFWVGTGPYYLDSVNLVGKTATLKNYANYVDLSDKWAGFAEPKLAEVELDGPGRVTIGEEATYTVYVTFAGDPYPDDEIATVKYMLFDATGEIVEVLEATSVGGGAFEFTLSAETTGALPAGSNKLEVAVVVIPVSIPSFSSLEFVTE